MNSKLLLDENPLVIIPSLARKIGLNEAVVLQQVHYWLRIAEQANDKRKFFDGKWWVYGSYLLWQEDNFPWWSVNTVGRIFRQLEKDGYLISRQPESHDWNQTKWYTIEYTKLESSSTPNRGDGGNQDGTLLNESETTSETTPKKKKSAPNGAPRTQPTAQQQMVEALALVTGFDLKINGARLGKAASKLVNAGYTRLYVMDKYGPPYSWWYQNDFRGRKGDKPTPEQVTETIGRTVATVRQPDPIDLDGLRRAVREAKPADDGMEY